MFENMLGAVAPINQMDGINSALARNSQMAAARPPKQKIRFADILGAIGDAMLIANGRPPIAMQMRQNREDMEREQQRNAAFANYLAGSDPELAALVGQVGPDALRLMERKQNTPGIIAEWHARNELPEGERGAFDQYVRNRFPGAMSPIIMGENDSLEMPQQDHIAEDANGNRVRYNPQSGAWEPIGGQTPQASGPFQQ